MNTREEWKRTLIYIVKPVLNGFKEDTIRTRFPKHYSLDASGKHTRTEKVQVELFCRTVLGVGPLFASSSVDSEILEIQELTRTVIQSAFKQDSTLVPFRDLDDQLLVEMALLALCFYRYPTLWNSLTVQREILNLFLWTTQRYLPHNNNWILFRVFIDLFLYTNGWIKNITDTMTYLRAFETFYVGDGWYKDGSTFHMDYYNSFVIHPFLVDIYSILQRINPLYKIHMIRSQRRMARQAEFLERLIGPDGTYPLFGRSIVYRTGVFHALTYSCVKELTVRGVSYGAIRCALTKVIQNTFTPQNLDENGFLHFGFMGHQPEVANAYSNSGSIYYCLLVFLPLGLPETHPFWAEPDGEWTGKRAWSGGTFHRDDSLKE